MPKHGTREAIKRVPTQQSVTPQIVRAKVKQFEDLPEWAKCCPDFSKVLKAEGEIQIVAGVSASRYEGQISCHYCKTSIPAGRAVQRADGFWMPAEILDFDEGQPAASPVAGHGTQEVMDGSEEA